ncbi:TOTE conflict system archaeo-eukaryotic primase domain-containing protein [Limosilactobacillus caccae]|uniref:TOTE conflict system archaeo-eukaryotic primase domain-containing protein n=1 Tax=Limosilactobacillus caccae TaxID=1926284 RepID=UPI001F45C948|nr:hypothetical protein [Limosilactobacillus caccae]
MDLGKDYQLNNGDSIMINQVFWHYGSKKKDYLVTSQSGDDWIIGEQELADLVQKKRTTKEKLELYAKYFSGRTDVYAQKWSNGKGYSPALKNWWSFYKLRNDKEAQKNLKKDYAPFTKEVIRDQILSSDKYHRYGIYPLLDDDTTNLLVFDFDKHASLIDPYETTKAVLATCSKYKIDCLPEISSSGSSYHLWLFFSQPIKASTVRF